MTQDYYRVGEKLRITIEGDAIDIGAQGGDTVLTLSYLLPEVAAAHAFIFTDSPAVKVERLVPVEGPPQRGDIWRGRSGADWFAFGNPIGQVYLMNMDGGGEPWEAVNQEDGPLSLNYRVPTEVIEQPPTRPQIAGIPSEDTVPIGGVAPGSFVICSDWNEGRPVEICKLEDSTVDPNETFVAWRSADAVWPDTTPVHVDQDMQVTPWTPDGGAL